MAATQIILEQLASMEEEERLLLRRSRTFLYYRVDEKASSVLIVALRSGMRGSGPRL